MIVVIGWITIETEATPRRTPRDVARAHACTWLTSRIDAELNVALARAESYLSATLASDPAWDIIEWTGFPDNEPDPLGKLRERLLACAAESTKALASFEAAARKVEASIATYAAGDLERLPISRAIGRLDDRRAKAEIAGSRRARTVTQAIVRRLRDAIDAAETAHVAARAAHYAAESKRLTDEARAARMASNERDPAYAAYHAELSAYLATR